MASESLSRPAVLEILQELIRTPSVNPSLSPDEAHGEEAIAKVVQNWLTGNGVKSWLEEVAPGRLNAVAEVGKGRAPTLVFCAHLDTVGTKGMTIRPFEPKVEGNRVYGRGSYDMKGSAAHGSRWDLGVSAIAKMGRIISALEKFDQEQLRRRVHPLVGSASQHCSLIEGGSGLSIYAEQCRLKVERRTLPGESPQRVMQELEEVIRSTGEEAQVSCLLDRPPLDCDRESKIATCLREAATSVTGATPEEGGVGYWMDAALFHAAGITTVNYGPGGAGTHEAVEWVDLDSVVSCAQVLAETARRFCNP
jgi:acetylornithine deacetylase/succinyl-diaminopimelate desuccinylase-like protein